MKTYLLSFQLSLVTLLRVSSLAPPHTSGIKVQRPRYMILRLRLFAFPVS